MKFVLGSNSQQASIGSDNGLEQNKPQSIVWTNGDLVNWRIYGSFGYSASRILALAAGKCDFDGVKMHSCVHRVCPSPGTPITNKD